MSSTACLTTLCVHEIQRRSAKLERQVKQEIKLSVSSPESILGVLFCSGDVFSLLLIRRLNGTIQYFPDRIIKGGNITATRKGKDIRDRLERPRWPFSIRDRSMDNKQ